MSQCKLFLPFAAHKQSSYPACRPPYAGVWIETVVEQLGVHEEQRQSYSTYRRPLIVSQAGTWRLVLSISSCNAVAVKLLRVQYLTSTGASKARRYRQSAVVKDEEDSYWYCRRVCRRELVNNSAGASARLPH